jgi:hypothetical protein
LSIVAAALMLTVVLAVVSPARRIVERTPAQGGGAA